MSPEPSLTVAVPTYHGTRHLAQALRSVLAQRGPSFDLVVSDDRSEDETLDVVRTEAGDRARVVVNSERLGLAGNWNQCVALSRTPYVAVFHQDDVMLPGHLAAHVRALGTGTSVGLVASAAEVIDDAGWPVAEGVVGRGGLGPGDRVFGPAEALPTMAPANPLRCSAVTLSKAAHAAIGGFDPSLRYVVDWDAWLKVARAWPVAWLAAPTVAIRWHAGSETHRFKTGTADLEESARLIDDLLRRDGAAWPDVRRLRRRADRGLARAYLARAHAALRGGDAPLARLCVERACRSSRAVLAAIAADPRLAVQLASLIVAPTWAARAWSRRDRTCGGRTRAGV